MQSKFKVFLRGTQNVKLKFKMCNVLRETRSPNMSCCDPIRSMCLLPGKRHSTIRMRSWKRSKCCHDTDTRTARAHLSQPSSKLSQLFINMKLCLSQVEQCDFLLRHTGIVWSPLRGRHRSFANFSVDTHCSGIHFPPDSLESPDLS